MEVKGSLFKEIIVENFLNKGRYKYLNIDFSGFLRYYNYVFKG